MKYLLAPILLAFMLAGCYNPPAVVKNAIYASQAAVHKDVIKMNMAVALVMQETDAEKAARLTQVLKDCITVEDKVDLNLQAVAEYFESGRLTDPATVGVPK